MKEGRSCGELVCGGSLSSPSTSPSPSLSPRQDQDDLHWGVLNISGDKNQAIRSSYHSCQEYFHICNNKNGLDAIL